MIKKSFNGIYYKSENYILLKPQTYVNNSGDCVLAFIKQYQISLENLLVIFDDTAFSLGQFRYHLQGSSGGHNGLKSIIDSIKSKFFKRLRIGIGRNKDVALHDWVLGKFDKLENKKITDVLPNLLESLIAWIDSEKFEIIMTNYNKKFVLDKI